MLQDDMKFIEPEFFSNIIKYAEINNIKYLSLGGGGNKDFLTTNVHYSDWAHIEHKSLRKECGDYRTYPRYYNTLKEQSTGPEPIYGENLVKNNIQFFKYYKNVCSPQFTDISIYQTLLHNINSLNISEMEKNELWNNPDIDILKKTCEKYNITFFKQ